APRPLRRVSEAMRGSRITPAVSLIALAMGAACVRAPEPPAGRAHPVLLAAESDPPSPPIPPEGGHQATPPARPKTGQGSLSVFLQKRATASRPRRPPRIDLGKIVHVDGDAPRRESIDVSNLDLPRELAREELPEALREGWDELFSMRDDLRNARRRQVRAS